ncbi:bifunctional 3-(3-hydroxy-phenyl)propionate/3-hydroxycinnamic acid hydroxylase [Actinoallomurus sp. NPDC052274]|uniref:bifunctional 3-(3-hydroxy-phenyl)propionate/3-hydroxycinnamic acid hydroxylase n=1 Tax=Actinoallomurus sp. NPDC052274 TaxID=3155420 RepID=UPI00341846AD
MTATTSDQYDVIVVGAGPTGLTLARLLAMKSVRVAVVDPNRIACPHPRATHIDDEIMRTLQTVGAADLEPGFLRMDGWILRDPGGDPFLSLRSPNAETDQAWYADYQFHQPDYESRLRGLLASSEHAELWLGWQVTAVGQTADHAIAQISDRATGGTRTLQAAYIVGADGAGSFLRPYVTHDVEDLHGTQRSLIVDIHPFAHPAELPATNGFIVCEADKPVTYCPIFPPKLRFEFMLGDGDDAEEYERPTTVYRLLARWLAPGDYRIQRTDVYEWHACLAGRWRNGRLFIAGDAAHEMPPMLGQGMCSGLRDAANLAWKLARVVTGRSRPDLLDTYEAERAAHVRPFIEESARQANMIEAFGYAEHRPHVTEPQTLDRLRPPLGRGLADTAGEAINRLAPQPRTADGTRFDDLVGYDFAVLTTPDVAADVTDRTRGAWADLDVAVITLRSPHLAAWLRDHEADAAIIRPDRYTYALTRGGAALDAATLALRQRLAVAEVSA